MNCCSDRSCYDENFSIKKAQKLLRSYTHHGLPNNSRPLLKILANLPLHTLSMLEIGGGIGCLTFELLQRGLTSAVLSDQSRFFIDVFISESRRHGFHDRVGAIQGDAVTELGDLASKDLVVLDKVICCYPHFALLLDTAGSKSSDYLAFSVPIESWWMKLYIRLENWLRYLRGNDFRSFIHPVQQMVEQVQSMDFEKIIHTKSGNWHYFLFKR